MSRWQACGNATQPSRSSQQGEPNPVNDSTNTTRPATHGADQTNLAIWRIDDTDVLHIDGVLDFTAAIRLRLTLFSRLDAGTRTIVVDLTGLRLIDASAVNILLTMRQRLTDLGGTLTTPGAHGPVLTILEIAGAAKQLHAYDTLDPRLADPTADTAQPIDPDPTHGHWGDEINTLLGRLAAHPTDDTTGRQLLREHIIQLCLPHAERLARRFHTLGESPADLHQVAAIGLLKAVDRYNPALGTDFPAYATPTIMGELKRHFRDRGWSVRVPRRLQELRLEINKAHEELTHQLGRTPTTTDLATHLDLDHDTITQTQIAAAAYRTTSLNTPISNDEEGPTLADRIATEDNHYDTIDNRQALRPLLACLPERERRIITMRFFDNMTQAHIAEQIGISQMHVSRLLTRTLNHLRQELLSTA
jgi:RNA polymerase sigma-B factor